MGKLFKKYFIPHQENDHKPHILRIEAALFLLSLVLLAETLFLIQALVVFRYTDILASIISSVLVDETNVNREEKNILPLLANDLLERAAYMKAQDMATDEYFAHTSPDGKSPWYWLDQVDYNYLAAGENLAVNFVDSEDVVNAWMDSPGHRANILNEKYTEIGIATARGKYKGQDAVFVVQYFGKPVSALAVVKPIEQIPGFTIPQKQTSEQQIAQSPPEVVKGEMTIEKTELLAETQEVGDEQKIPIVGQEKLSRTSQIIAFLQKVLVTPKVTADFLLIVLATIISLALLLKIFIKIKIQHPPLIVNGVLLLIIISSTILINHYITMIGLEIS
jgi:hypothetical protein